MGCLMLSAYLLLALSRSLPAAEVVSKSDTVLTSLEFDVRFNNADMRSALYTLASLVGYNVVLSEEIVGNISLRLQNANLQSALDAIVIAKGFDYEIRDKLIRVASAEALEKERVQRGLREKLEPLTTEVVTLNYLDANDVKPLIEPMLSERGAVAVLANRPFRGFQFSNASAGGGGSSESESSSSSEADSSGSSAAGGFAVGASAGDRGRSSKLMITDVRLNLDRVLEVIQKADTTPRQVWIDAKILEVTSGVLDDLGIQFESSSELFLDKNSPNTLTTTINSGASSDGISSNILGTEYPSRVPNTGDAGFYAFFENQRENFSVTLHTLLQDRRTRILSSPTIRTMDNQEAAILVGEQYPVFETTVTDQGTATESFAYYQPVGVSLQVIPQINPNGYITMILHPSVSSLGDVVTGSTGLEQRRISIREADTRVLVKNGETIMIGGLIVENTAEKSWRIPGLGHIPILSDIFTRNQVDKDKTNLLIFITPKIVDLEDPSRHEIMDHAIKAVELAYENALKSDRGPRMARKVTSTVKRIAKKK